VAEPRPNHFEVFADIDIDGAALRVGLLHYALGPPGPAMQVNAGAVEVQIRAHITDIDAMIDALKAARKKLRQVQP
jgi:hypothetical protein